MSDSRQKPVDALRDEVAQLRDALRNLRESVVLRVMYRDKLQEEVTRLQRGVSDMEKGIGLAERANDAQLAEQFRQEKASRATQLEQFETRLKEAAVQAEAAKIGLPEEEASLLRQLNDLQAQAVRATAMQVEANLPGNFGTSTDNLWERASSKIADLQREASARQEVASVPRLGTSALPTAGVSGGTAEDTVEMTPRLSPDESAEQMLLALEAKIAAGQSPLAAITSPQPVKPATPVVPSTPVAARTPVAASTPAPVEPSSDVSVRARYLEFDEPTPTVDPGHEVAAETPLPEETAPIAKATPPLKTGEPVTAEQAEPAPQQAPDISKDSPVAATE